MERLRISDSAAAWDRIRQIPSNPATRLNGQNRRVLCRTFPQDPLILSGHTFSPDTETPKRVLRRWPDANYPPGHTCNNPFGTWRLGRSGSKGEPPGELAISFMPALVVLLGAVEEQKGKPLTKKQVEAVVSNACCMTVGHEEARAVERARGYADLDPELAWEQWQLARRTV